MGQAALARLPASSGHLRTPAYKMSMKTFFFLNHRHVSTHAEEDRGIGIFSTRGARQGNRRQIAMRHVYHPARARGSRHHPGVGRG